MARTCRCVASRASDPRDGKDAAQAFWQGGGRRTQASRNSCDDHRDNVVRGVAPKTSRAAALLVVIVRTSGFSELLRTEILTLRPPARRPCASPKRESAPRNVQILALKLHIVHTWAINVSKVVIAPLRLCCWGGASDCPVHVCIMF
jgi:hypothetical protein